MPGCVRRLLLVLTLACPGAAQDEIAQLRDPDPDVRQGAAERLGEQRVAAAVPALIDAILDPSLHVAGAAIDALGRIGPPAREAVPRLEELVLAHPGFRDRVGRAVEAIGRPEPTVPALIVWLRKKGKLAQLQTLDGNPGNNVEPLLTALRAKDPAVRGQAALVLGMGVANRPEVVAALLAARNQESAYVRGHVLHALVKDGATAAQAFAKDLEHDDVSVRRVAALALKRMATRARAVMPALIRAVKDEDYHVQRDAIRAIGAQRAASKEAVIALTEVLEEGDERLYPVIAHACLLLGRDAAPATPALALLLEAEDPSLRTWVCDALATIGPEAAVATPKLIQAVYDETWLVTTAALRALERIGPDAAAAAPYVAEFGESHPFGRGAAPQVLRALAAGKPLPPAPRAEELPLLLGQLAHGEPEVAGKAAFAIGRLAPQDAATRAALRVALRRKTPYVRRHASLALLRIGPASAPVLMEALTQGDLVERRLAADVLCQLAREVGVAALPAWQRALADSDALVRRHTCSAIGVVGAPARAAIPTLIALLRDPDAGVAQSAAWALGNMKSAAVGTVGVLTEVLAERAGQGLGWSILVALGEFGAASEPAIPTIKEAVRRNRDLLRPALETLGKIGPPGHAAVVDFIRDERGFGRRFAIEHALRTGIRAPGLREALEQAMQDEEPGTRQVALQALRWLKPEGGTSVAALVAVMRREPMGRIHHSQVPHALAARAEVSELLGLVTDDDESVRWAAFRALFLKKPDEFSAKERKRARELASRASADKSPQVRTVAAGLLRQLPPARVTPELIRRVGATSEVGERRAIAASLAAVGAPAVPTLIRALEHRDPALRRGAAATINQMGLVAREAIPALTAALTADDEDARLFARALTAIGKDALAAWAEAYGKVKDKNARYALRRAMIQQGAATVPHVDALRKKGDAATRRWIVEILGQIGEPALFALLDAASDPDSSAAGTALSALGRIRGHVSKIGPVLARGLRRRETRRAAVSALSSQGEAVLPYLWQAAGSDDPGVRAGAYAALPSHAEEAAALLRRGLGDPDDGARAAAVRAAGARAKPPIPDLVRALRDKSERVRSAAAYALGHVKQVPATALPELLRLFRVGTLGERKAAHAALIALDASPHVMRFLADPDRALRASAAGLLVKMGPAVVPSLIDMIKSHDDPARQAAAEVLARLRAQDSLVALLVDEKPGVRASAAHGLGRMGRRARGAVPDLIEALDDPKAGGMAKAVWALGEIGPGAAAAVPKLIEALDRPEPDIVREAVWALAKMGPDAAAAIPKLVQLGKQEQYRKPVALALRAIRRKK